MRQLFYLLAWVSLTCSANSQFQLQNGDIITADCQLHAKRWQCVHPTLGHFSLAHHQLTALATAPPAPPSSIHVASTPQKDSELWQLAFDISASKRHGTQDSDSLLLKTNWKFHPNQWRYSVAADYDFETKQGSRKTHKYQLSPALDFFINPQLFVRSQLEFNYDFLANDYQNLDVSAGPGWRWWTKDEDNYAETMLSYGVKKAWFRAEDNAYQGLFQLDPPLTYQFVALDWDARRQLWQALSVYAKGRYLKMTSQPVSLLDFNSELDHELGLRYHLTDQIRISYSWGMQRTRLAFQLPNAPAIPLSLLDIHQQLAVGAEF